MTRVVSMLRKHCDRLKMEVAELAVPAQACHHLLLPRCPLSTCLVVVVVLLRLPRRRACWLLHHHRQEQVVLRQLICRPCLTN